MTLRPQILKLQRRFSALRFPFLPVSMRRNYHRSFENAARTEQLVFYRCSVSKLFHLFPGSSAFLLRPRNTQQYEPLARDSRSTMLHVHTTPRIRYKPARGSQLLHESVSRAISNGPCKHAVCEKSNDRVFRQKGGYYADETGR